jgi:hypothetical protein
MSNCVPDVVEGPDMSGSVPTLLCNNTDHEMVDNTDPTNPKCVPSSSICLAGTTFDPINHTCAPTVPCRGTMLGTSAFKTMYVHMYYADTTTTPTSYKPLGSATTITAMISGAAPPTTTPLFMADGTTFGGRAQNVRYPGGPQTFLQPTATPLSKQFTLGEYQTCNGSISVYKPTDYNAMTNNRFNVVADLSGCPADYLYSMWFFYSPGDMTDLAAAYVSRQSVVPAGGFPNLMLTDGNGQSHFERKMDANIYFKHGSNLGGYGAAHTSATIPTTGGLLLPIIVTHLTGQSSANAGACPLKADGTCAAADATSTVACAAAVPGNTCNNAIVTAPFPNYQFIPLRAPGTDGSFSNMAAITLDSIQPDATPDM